MQTITISKEKFSKILEDVEMLISDVECAMSEEEKIVKKRINDVEVVRIEGRSEDEYYAYLKKRGIKVDRVDRSISS